nr:hypothetical protein HK105_002575 [Polyrhizophydium stewartii]
MCRQPACEAAGVQASFGAGVDAGGGTGEDTKAGESGSTGTRWLAPRPEPRPRLGLRLRSAASSDAVASGDGEPVDAEVVLDGGQAQTMAWLAGTVRRLAFGPPPAVAPAPQMPAGVSPVASCTCGAALGFCGALRVHIAAARIGEVRVEADATPVHVSLASCASGCAGSSEGPVVECVRVRLAAGTMRVPQHLAAEIFDISIHSGLVEVESLSAVRSAALFVGSGSIVARSIAAAQATFAAAVGAGRIAVKALAARSASLQSDSGVVVASNVSVSDLLVARTFTGVVDIESAVFLDVPAPRSEDGSTPDITQLPGRAELWTPAGTLTAAVWGHRVLKSTTRSGRLDLALWPSAASVTRLEVATGTARLDLASIEMGFRGSAEADGNCTITGAAAQTESRQIGSSDDLASQSRVLLSTGAGTITARSL